MATTIGELFSPITIARALEKFGNFADKNTALQQKFDPAADWVRQGESIQWDEHSYSRTLAPASTRQGKAPESTPMSRTRRSATLADFKLEEFIPASSIVDERAFGEGPTVREGAERHVGRVLRNLQTRIALSIEKACAQAFTGTLAINSTAFPGSKVEFADLTYAVSTFDAGAAWATSSTKILSGAAELPKAKDDFRKACGDEIGEIWYNQSVNNELIANTEIQAWLQQTQAGVSVFRRSFAESGGMADVGVWREYNGHHILANGDKVPFIADSRFIAFPMDASLPGLFMARGYGIVPGSGLAMAPSAEAAASICPVRAPSPGWYGYAYQSPNPLGVHVVVGWSGLPIIQFPQAIMYGITT